MAAPLAVVGDVHSLFTLAAGLGDRPVAVDHRLGEELLRLLAPDVQSRFVDRFHEDLDLRRVLEPPAEVAFGRRVGDPLSPQGVPPTARYTFE